MFVTNIITFQNILHGNRTPQRIQVIRVNLKLMFNSRTMILFLFFPLNFLWTQGVSQSIQLHFGNRIQPKLKKEAEDCLVFYEHASRSQHGHGMSLFSKIIPSPNAAQFLPAAIQLGASAVSNHTGGSVLPENRRQWFQSENWFMRESNNDMVKYRCR